MGVAYGGSFLMGGDLLAEIDRLHADKIHG
nr:MAG TPA: hypothetical protein [Caudoviricetes sp.]